ncbi:hypothetical protein [Halorussus salinus]|uniref:hypothetical protein n=1 Tax=Halorussus salinus TaxID=1364935 RepID=UPI001091A3BF|nr:hypothetical protein [Halorussus salinus]
MTDADTMLTDVHRMLEVVAFLLAVLILQNGGTLGVVVGGGAAFLLGFNALWRATETTSE